MCTETASTWNEFIWSFVSRRAQIMRNFLAVKCFYFFWICFGAKEMTYLNKNSSTPAQQVNLKNLLQQSNIQDLVSSIYKASKLLKASKSVKVLLYKVLLYSLSLPRILCLSWLFVKFIQTQKRYPTSSNIKQKQPPRVVLKKRCSENMQQIYRRTTMPKCDFNKVPKQLYWKHTSAW